MANSVVDYGKIFNHLCHMVVLSKKGQVNAVVDDLVITALVIDGSKPGTSTAYVISLLNDFFGIHLPERQVEDSLLRLQQSGRLARDKATEQLVVPINTQSAIAGKITEANNLERAVKTEWESDHELKNPQIRREWYDELWRALIAYMAKAFGQHGAETIQLLQPSLMPSQARHHLSLFLDQAVTSHCTGIPSELAKRVIREFFATSTSLRAKYLSQLLDATFAFYAVTTNEATADYLRGQVSSMSLFLDTNFIFGVLDLHSNPFDVASKELVEAIRQHGFPFKLYVHPATLSELTDTISSYGQRLRSVTSWRPEISRAVLQANTDLSGLELAYHRRNAESPLSPEVFLSRFDHLSDLLTKEHGFRLYNTRSSSKVLDQERYTLIASLDHFVNTHRKKPKPYRALEHDIRVWQTVRTLRPDINSSPLDAKAYFITADYYLYRFDWEELRGNSDLGITVLPSQFLQLLRPFTKHTDDFDKRFVETFAIPEFRTLAPLAQVTSKVLEYMNAYSDLKEETAVRILANQVMNQRLIEAGEDAEQIQKILDTTLLEENQRLQMVHDELLNSSTESQKENEELREQLAELRTMNIDLQQQIRDIELKNDRTTESSHFTNKPLVEETHVTTSMSIPAISPSASTYGTKNEEHRQNLWTWSIRGLVFIVTCALIWALFAFAGQWKWLSEHQNRLGLMGTTSVVLIALALAITDRARVGWYLGTLAAGAIFVLLQILGN